MKRSLFCLSPFLALMALVFTASAFYGQGADTLARERLLQVDFGIMPFNFFTQTPIEQLKKVSPGEEALYRNFENYKDNGVMIINGVPRQWYLGLTRFQHFKNEKPFSWSLGLRYHQVLLAGRGYYSDTSFVVDTFQNNQGAQIVQSRQLTESITFLVGAHEVLVPAGIHWTGKSRRLIWVEFGLQVFPGIIFAPTFRSYESFSVWESYSKLGSAEEAQMMFQPDSGYSRSGVKSLNGIGYSLNAGAPLTLCFRASKKHHITSRIQVLINITPYVRYERFRALPAQQYIVYSTSLGARFRL